MTRAAIDLGSNSVLLTVVDAQGAVLHDEARVVGLGKGLGDGGRFREDRMLAAPEALADYARIAAGLGVDPVTIRAVTTSAARRATNAADFFSALRAELRLDFRVITGDEEARLSWLGATHALPDGGQPRVMIDIGGGSTEVVVGRGDTLAARCSLEAGSVRLTEAFLGTALVSPQDLARARTHVAALVETLTWPHPVHSAVSVAGTATTLAAMDAGLTAFDPDIVHGHVLTRAALAAQASELEAAGPERRRELARVSPARADYLLAGTLLLDTILAAAGLAETVVSARGLRFGVLLAGEEGP